MNSFFTIKNESEAIFKDKGSKFIAFALPVNTVEEALNRVKDKRKEFFDARHVCYAYVLGCERDVFRANDDGEPSGTAGKPILGQINSKELTNILIVVVRYFGGTLLGTSGLINAYKTAASDAIDSAQIEEIAIEKIVRINFGYDNLNFVMRMVKDFELKIINQQQASSCTFTLSCKQVFVERLIQRLDDNHLINYDFV
ncbi:Xaa-Pro dipeptidase [Porphyromonadaceae bacterium COT-184 OH4590]|nr:Xaa-Pro dipeptidase [Porphyromonadaceae bacterium COT-184 OH4590]